jgi:hypothetical protein
MEIRNKITGEAGDLLASSGTPLDWEKIKEQLRIIYGDKRELSTLLQKLFSVRQSRNSVRDFYTTISDCYTGISSHIQMDAQWRHPEELIKFVDKLCLEKFIDGLEEPFSSHVGLLQPNNLGQAYQFANDKANKIARRTGECDLNNRQRTSQQYHQPPAARTNYTSKPTNNIPNNPGTSKPIPNYQKPLHKPYTNYTNSHPQGYNSATGSNNQTRATYNQQAYNNQARPTYNQPAYSNQARPTYNQGAHTHFFQAEDGIRDSTT